MASHLQFILFIAADWFIPVWSHLPVERRHSGSDRLTSLLLERFCESTKEGEIEEGPGSMTVLDMLIDPVEEGAAAPS